MESDNIDDHSTRAERLNGLHWYCKMLANACFNLEH